MKHRFIVCHTDPHNYGSHITWRATLRRAKTAAEAHANEGKIGVWDSEKDKYVYETGITQN